ncbi:MAG: AAA family ATPase [Chloroflexi bacterium]|nr:AAA family ATPase [Chloroflexota bacterium]
MKLVRAKVTNFKSIDDTGWVDVDDVTCMVGKNESGKTAFLGALKRLNPVDGKDKFDLKDYPRKGYVRYKRDHGAKPAIAITTELELSEDEMRQIEESLGRGALKSPQVTVAKDYANELHWDVQVNEHAIVRHLMESANLPLEVQEHAQKSQTIGELVKALESLDVKPAVVQKLLDDVSKRFEGEDAASQLIGGYLNKFLPKFVYFDEYSAMRGRISIQDLVERVKKGEEMDESDRTFLSLLSLVGANLEDMDNQTNYEYLKAELESASIGISDEIFEYWNQNKQLRVEFDLSAANPDDPPPLNKGTILHVRIWNNRHRVSVPFDERSKGFVWFFSFLSYFSKIEEEQDTDLVLLLDEPGLNLHAMAQHDFLRFIDERLAPKHQVIYTTHSPFMINLKHLDRIRTVQDVDDRGTVISDDTLSNDQETVFPLQVALGHRLANTLFLAPHCLMVNDASDLILLQIIGEFVSAKGHQRLDPRWVVIPVGGADNLPSFVSLLGENYVSVAVLMDVTPKNKEKMEAINKNSHIHRSNPIKWVEVTKVRTADIEDILDPAFYLKLVNAAYAGELPEPITMKAITDSEPRIAKRLEVYFEAEGLGKNGQFEAYRPAAYLLEHHAELRGEIDEATIERAASMFERVNALLPANGAGDTLGAFVRGASNGSASKQATAAPAP